MPCCCLMHTAYQKNRRTERGTLFGVCFSSIFFRQRFSKSCQLISNRIAMSACLAEHNTQPFVSQPAIWSLQSLGRLGFPLVSAGSSLQWVSQQYWDYCSGSVACLWLARLRLRSSVLWKWKQCPTHRACLALGPGRHPEIQEHLSEMMLDLIAEWLWSSCPCSWGRFLLLPYQTEDQTWH